MTTLDNGYLLLESLEGGAGGHTHEPITDNKMIELFWGVDILDVIRNHPDMSDQEVLETLFVLYDNKIEVVQHDGMLDHISKIRSFKRV